MANATVKPSGLKVTRNGLKFTFSWKIGDKDYGAGHKVGWKIKTGKADKGAWSGWTYVDVGAKTTTYSKSFSASAYWPTTKIFLYAVTFAVKGKRTPTTKNDVTTKYSWSDWTFYTFRLVAPATPTMSQSLDDQMENVTTFTWNTKTSETDDKPFYNCEWQTMLVKECKETDGSKLKWKTTATGWGAGTGTKSGTKTITEDPELLAKNSYTRWMRIRARGCGGNGGIAGCSYWRYAKHVYARPEMPKINSVAKEGSLNWIRVNWTAGQNAAHPIDAVTVDYTIGTPLSGLAVPGGANWETARTFKDTGGKDEAFFLVNDAVDVDECLWVRVGVQHDRNWIATGGKVVVKGKLSAPTDLSVSANDTTPDSKLAVLFRKKVGKTTEDIVVGIIPHNQTTVTVQCPDWSESTAVAFGVYAFQGSTTEKKGEKVGEYTVKTYSVTANMKSGNVWGGGSYVPVEPDNVTAQMTDTPGEVLLTWDWKWTSANRAEISWSQNQYAWESTEEPEVYMITALNAPRWRVSALETGMTWYFRIRLAQQAGDEIVYGPYCDPVPVDLSSAPSAPTLLLSTPVIPPEGSFTASWAYATTDGTMQSYAEVRKAEVEGVYQETTDTDVIDWKVYYTRSGSGTELDPYVYTPVDDPSGDPSALGYYEIIDVVTIGDVVKSTTTAQHVDIDADSTWLTGTHYFVVRVKSSSGHMSEYSDPVPLAVADPIVCTIEQTSLVEETVDGQTVLWLTEMPLTATITGADEGETTMIIERAAEYHMIRPDGSELDGYEDETIAIMRQTGESEITLLLTDLLGRLDDGAPYRLIATVEDGLGQTASAEIEFEVHWAHQAEIPEATVEMEDGVAVITVEEPEGAVTGDVCDIYRLTADLPELIVEGGAFDTAYVDPYPAIGPGFGHRCVHRTVNGDYITEDDQPAWTDLTDEDGDILEEYSIIVDFDGRQLILPYDISLISRWEKDFKKTDYLGGSQQGDWNPAVTRTATYTCNLIADEDAETIRGMRMLAAYTGICHVRTPEGSSYSADIQVTESKEYTDWETAAFTLEVTKVDPEVLDGIPYSEWITNELE